MTGLDIDSRCGFLEVRSSPLPAQVNLMLSSPTILLASAAVTLGAVVIGALIRRGQETGSPVLRFLRYLCPSLLALGVAIWSGGDYKLGATIVVGAFVFACGALASFAMEAEWDPTFAFGLFATVFAGLFVMGGNGEPLALAISTACAAFAGAVFAPLPDHARSMTLEGGLA